MNETSAPATTHLATTRPTAAVLAAFSGWTLDAFDFFTVVFVFDQLTTAFHVTKAAVVLTTTVTLALRPVGAFIFGLLADRFGRRAPLIGNVIFFTLMEVLCGFAPNFTTFLVLRALFGIGMGGEWGVGASLAMEAAPQRRRGLFSGVLQSGYSLGYLFASVAARFVLPLWGWRAMFWVGTLPALLALYFLLRARESEAWKQNRPPGMRAILRDVAAHWKLLLYLIGLMALLNALSHGTQDLYPDFLKDAHGFSTRAVADILILYNLGAITGGILFGQLSERLGRRRGMLIALALALIVLPSWSFASAVPLLLVSAFLMQTGVQGAWGIIPAHLNELAPDRVRGLMPGFAYQMGVLIASPTNTIEYRLRESFGYSRTLALFEVTTMVLMVLMVAFGPERFGKRFVHDHRAAPE